MLAHSRGVAVSITGENGETQRYQAQSVTLQMVHGGLEVLQNHRGCFGWFEHCQLEARAGRKRVVLRFASGVVSSCGTELTVVATIDPALPRSPKSPATKSPVGKRTIRPSKTKSAL
ncbi:MAG: hypothetical protein ABIP85_03680 [Chthoniobacteraceae bacterium]